MRHEFTIGMGRRQDAGAVRCIRSSAVGELLRPAHGGRYFGGLWFKVFSERGPC